MRLFCFLIIGYFCSSVSAQPSSIDIIKRSITYHDPKGKLSTSSFTLHLSETRPNGSDRYTEFYLDEKSSHCLITSQRDDHEIIMSKTKNGVRFLIDGRSELSDDEIKKYRLTEERLEFMKNYYRYLWMAPLVLTDPGTVIHDQVEQKDFFGTESLEVKVTYDPSVGEDIWYFYFHPETFAMVGYRFYHDESANDGEYILLSDEIVSDQLRLPQTRKWYTHKEDKYLGADKLEKLTLH